MAMWSLSVLTVQALPPQIKSREVAELSAALSHIKPRRRPYTWIPQIKLAGIRLTMVHSELRAVKQGRATVTQAVRAQEIKDEPPQWAELPKRCAAFNLLMVLCVSLLNSRACL